MKRPLCSVALFYIGGILLGSCARAPLAGLLAVSLAIALAALFLARWRIYLLTLLLVLAGWTNYTRHTAIISPVDLRLLAGPALENAGVRGLLHDSPTARIFEREGREFWHSTVIIDCTEARLDAGWQPAAGKIIATVPGLLGSNFFSGQSVEVSGTLGPPPDSPAEGLFDARSHYQHQGIYFQLRTASSNAWRINPDSPPRAPPLADRFTAWARKTLAMGLGPEDAALRLVWTLALDWKAPLSQPVEEPFMRAGTYHIFAVDGLRIGLLAGIGIALLRALQLPRGICGLLVAPLIWSYAGLTGWPASAVRAAVMMTIVILGWAGRRPVDLVNSLFAAAFVILLWDPSQLFQPGFQLSFVVVLCIALLLPLLQERFKSWLFAQDPFLPKSLAPRWPPAAYAAAVFVIDTGAVSIAAWLGSVPLAAAYFHLFTPVSVPANIIVVPVTALALMSSMGSLLTGAWFPGLTVLFNHAAWFFMNCIITLSRWAGQWEPGSCNVAAPSPTLLILYYSLLLALLTGWIYRPKIKWPAILVLGGLTLGWMAQRTAESGVAHVHCLPLNGGAAVFAGIPGENFLFDCGNVAEAESITRPFLRAHGVNRLDGFVLTTGHVADGGGAAVVASNFLVKQFFVSSIRDRSSGYRAAVEDLRQRAHVQTVQAGGNAAAWSALSPAPNTKFDNADDNALVFRRDIAGHSILLLSSLGRAGQSALLTSQTNLTTDIVVCGMPMQDEPLCEALLRQLQPQLIIIIDSNYPVTRRASSKLRDRLAAHGIPVYYCHETGALKLSLWPGGWSVQNPSGGTALPAAGLTSP